MIESLLYVSRSTLFMPDDEVAVQAIIEAARVRNAGLDVSGALIFTHTHFAQYLEGPEAAVADLMASIRRDPRHRDIELVTSGARADRRFAGWDMAYAGPSLFIGMQVEALSESSLGDASKPSAERVIRLMAEFARQDKAPRAA